MTDIFSKSKRSEIMSKIRSKDTRFEKNFRRELWKSGARGYRLYSKKVFGTPDIAFIEKKIAVFLDSAFWHGLKGTPSSNVKYWKIKFEKNRKRDAETTKKLEADGWVVLRFTDDQIKKDINACILKIKNAIKNKSS